LAIHVYENSVFDHISGTKTDIDMRFSLSGSSSHASSAVYKINKMADGGHLGFGEPSL
jgi:hypothetical protein